ncbi:hypothetical protein BKA63DRAFT_91729 [Paraphoma chrysanthemicola]|nr:hypothetical protein BKA63DRAFT_91729 [Paraphoma chrysanthemicola]
MNEVTNPTCVRMRAEMMEDEKAQNCGRRGACCAVIGQWIGGRIFAARISNRETSSSTIANVNACERYRRPSQWRRKSRTIMVRLISMAMTGYYRTMQRPRAHQPLSMLKYDPIVRKQVLFLEAKRGKK